MPNGPEPRRGELFPDGFFWVVFGGIPLLFAITWLAAQLSALVTTGGHAAIAASDAARAVPRLPGRAGDPAAAFGTGNNVGGPVAFWTAVAVVAVGLAAAGVAVAVAAGRRRGRPGMAGRRDLRSLRARAVTDRAAVLRPDLDDASTGRQLAGAGVELGRPGRGGPRLYASVEDSILVIAPPRAGKTARMVIPTVVDHDGPAVVTSTRWDAVRLTAAARRRRGPVWVFDADQRSTMPLPAGAAPARWSPVAGAEDPQTAMMRARSLARASGAGEGIAGGDFFKVQAEIVLRCYLHAAALSRRSIGDVRRWSTDPTNKEANGALRSSPAASAWANELDAQQKAADRQRDGVWGVAQQALAALADPRLLETCDPPHGEAFHPDELLASDGTLFVVGQAETQDVVAPLVATLVEAVADAARRAATGSRGGRLSPPLLLALDEVANIAPLPTLPTLLADGGGTGITTMIVLQSRSQARARWGDDAAEAIIAACTHRLILGGGGELRELEDLARLVGERDDEVRSHSWQPWSGGGAGMSTSTQLRRVPTITPADLQAMAKGQGVLLSPACRPVEVTVPAWWERPHAAELHAASDAATAPRPAPTEIPSDDDPEEALSL